MSDRLGIRRNMTEQTIRDPVPKLLEELTDSDPHVRGAAARALGRLGSLAKVEASEAVADNLRDADPSVRIASAEALGQMAAVAQLTSALSNPDKYVRRHVVWALARLGDGAAPAVHPLARTLNDLDPRTATGAAQALARLGPLAEPVIPELIEALGHSNRVICRLSARALSCIGPAALQSLFGPLFHEEEFVRDEAVCALNWMEDRLVRAGVIALVAVLRNDRDPQRRLIAIRALGKLGRRAANAGPALRDMQADPSEDLRHAAMFALRRIGETR